jgi:hypothetical protein
MTRAHQVLYEVWHSQAAEAPQCESPDGGILIPAVLEKQVDGEQCQVGVGLGIVGDVKVEHLFEDYVLAVGSCTGHNLHEQAAHVDTNGEVVDYLFE